MAKDYRLKFIFGGRADASLAKSLAQVRNGLAEVNQAAQRLSQVKAIPLAKQLSESAAGLKNTSRQLSDLREKGDRASHANDRFVRQTERAKRSVRDHARSLRKSALRLKEHAASIRKDEAAIRKLGSEYEKTAKKMAKWQSANKRRPAAGGAGGGMPTAGELMGVAAPVMAVAAPVKQAIDFESSMADVRKVVNFKEPDGLKKLGATLVDLSADKIPIAAKGLAEIAAAGGQLGIASRQIPAFVVSTSKMAVAWDMLSAEAGESSAKLSNVYGIPITQVERLGDAINHLSDNTPAKASEVVRAMLRVGGTSKQFGLAAQPNASGCGLANGGTSKQFGLAAQQTAALAAGFIALGKPPEVAGTAINGMLTKLMTADKGEKSFKKALSQMGIDAHELKDSIQNDAQGALMTFLETVANVDKAEQMGLLVDLFGREYADDVATLVGALDKYKESVALVADEQSYLGSMTKEFENRSKTTANALTLLANKATRPFIDQGTAQLPVFNGMISAVGELLDGLNALAREFPNVSSGLAHVVGGVAAAIAVFKAGKLAGRFFSSGLKDIFGLGRKGFDRLRGKKGKAAGLAGGLLSGAAGVVPVQVVNWPGGGMGALDLLGGGGKGKAGKGLVRAGRKGLLGRAAGFMGRAGGMARRVGMGALGLFAGAPLAGAAANVGGRVAGAAGLKIAGKGGLKAAGKVGLKSVGKSLLKKIPGVGLLAGVGFGLHRAIKGDWLGALGEVASGAASLIPGIGTAASVALDAGLAARDIAKENETGNEPSQAEKPLTTLAAEQKASEAAFESVFNVHVTQNVNAAGADAKSLEGILKQGRDELERLFEPIIERALFNLYHRQQRMSLGNVGG